MDSRVGSGKPVPNKPLTRMVLQKGGFGGCSPRTETGTFTCSLGTKTGTSAHSPKPPFYETAPLSPGERLIPKSLRNIFG